MPRNTVKPGTPHDFTVKVTIDRHPVRFFVHKRPHVDFFLDVVSENCNAPARAQILDPFHFSLSLRQVSQWYDLVVFTASMEIYGAAVADKLDNGRNILRRRYYRQHCTPDFGSYTKDLTAICNDLNRVSLRRTSWRPMDALTLYIYINLHSSSPFSEFQIFIIDNSPGAYRCFPNNAIPIKSWFSDPMDICLLSLLPLLDALRFTNDVRSVLSRNLHLHRLW